MPKTERGNCCIITFVDYFSKWPEAEPIPSLTRLQEQWQSFCIRSYACRQVYIMYYVYMQFKLSS